MPKSKTKKNSKSKTKSKHNKTVKLREKLPSLEELLSREDEIKYLENDICNFRFVNPENYGGEKKKDIISICFFKMNNHYKDFSVYLRGLDNWINYLNTNKHTSNIRIRMFIDQNIYKDKAIMKRLTSSDKIELVLFTCSKYMNKEGFHVDVFGSMVRFFPAFDYPNNDANNVLLADIDLNGEDLYRVDVVIKNKNKIIQMNPYKEPLVNGLISQVDLIYSGYPPHIYAGLTYLMDLKVNHKILDNFIKNPKVSLKNRTNKNYNKKGQDAGKFGYGIDEIFLNNYWYKEFNTAGAMMLYTPAFFVYWSNKRINSHKKSKHIFRQILGKYGNDDMSLKEMIRMFDNQFYSRKNRKYYKEWKFDNKTKYLASRFYKAIKMALEKKIYFMEKNIMELIVGSYNNIIRSDTIVFTDLKTNKYKVEHIKAIKI